MATREIIDFQGNIIGTLELPDFTAESVWSEKLAVYRKDPAEILKVTPEDYVERVSETLQDMLSSISAKLPDDQMKKFGDFMSPVLFYILSGRTQILLDYINANPSAIDLLGKQNYVDLIGKLKEQISQKPPDDPKGLK